MMWLLWAVVLVSAAWPTLFVIFGIPAAFVGGITVDEVRRITTQTWWFVVGVAAVMLSLLGMARGA